MNLFFKSLASGSSGNSAILYTKNTKILIDCGITRKRIKEALESCAIALDELDAIFITHAHHDHVAGLPVLIKNTKCPIYCSLKVFERLKTKSKFGHITDYVNRFHFFEYGAMFSDISVDLCQLPHDGWLYSGADKAGDHYGFVFSHKTSGAKVGYATDVGHFPDEHISTYYNCDFYFIESNHDVYMQRNSDRPMGLIKRNLSNIGHLSNDQCSEVMVKFIPKEKELRRTKNVVLAHLSQDCNQKDLACRIIKEGLEGAGISGVDILAAPCRRPGELIVV